MVNRASEGYRRAMEHLSGVVAALDYIRSGAAPKFQEGKRRSTDNNSGRMDGEIVLPQTARNRARAEKVNAVLAEAKGHGIATTRRQARKMLHGRGSLRQQLREAAQHEEKQ